MEQFQIYRDIQARTNGEVYIGVVGPVRTGKSTFIRRFMELVGIPQLSEYEQKEIRDQLPISGSGKMITTVEPKFIPKNGLKVELSKDIDVNIKLIDCVGFVIPDSEGNMDNGMERMIKTPWMEQEIPFREGARIGTIKVIEDHATLGILLTTDGSFGDIPRENFVKAEEECIDLLKQNDKPFVIIVNSSRPYSQETRKLMNELKGKYDGCVISVNCDQLRYEDINIILENMLLEFPVTQYDIQIPKWSELLDVDHPLKKSLIQYAKTLSGNIKNLHDVKKDLYELNNDYIKKVLLIETDPSNGKICFCLEVDERYYYKMLSEMTDTEIESEYELVRLLKDLSQNKYAYQQVKYAVEQVRNKGYGIVMPGKEEIELETPELIRQGNKYGVLIRANSPSIHMIKANIETEIAPIVGSEEQANDLIRYIEDARSSENGIWETNIFGKSIEQLVGEGIQNKVNMISDASQQKLQDTMQKIVNDSKGGMVCIII